MWFEESELAMFEPRQQLVVRLRSNMDDGIEHQLGEVGALFGVNRERVRTIQHWVLVKITHLRREQRQETMRVVRRTPPLPGKAKVDVGKVRRWLDHGIDKPWRYPKDAEDEERTERDGNFFVQRPAPKARYEKKAPGSNIKAVRMGMFGMRWMPGVQGIYLLRYGLVVPAANYSAGQTTSPEGKISVLPAWRQFKKFSAGDSTLITVRIDGRRGPLKMGDPQEVKERLEKRVVNILQEAEYGLRLTTSDGTSTLRNDEAAGFSVRSETRKKTKAERAAERARLDALCEALELVTSEPATEVEARLRVEAKEDEEGALT